MDIPALVQEHLGGEELQTGIMLGDDDVICLTPTRTLLYRAEGLLSDESVSEFPHELERLQLKEGRRKSKFVFEYVEDKRSLTVPNDVAGDVLELLLEGVLTTEGVLDDDESVVGAFRFSELTLVVGQRRVVKHVGNEVWEGDYEAFAYEDLTGLDFEKASVATEVVMRIDGRPQRIKTPNDEARLVEKTIQKAVFEFFEVTSMQELRAHFDAEAGDDADESPTATSGRDDLTFDSEIEPLGGDAGSESPFSDGEDDDGSEPAITDAEAVETASDESGPDELGAPNEESSAVSAQTATSGSATRDDLEAVEEQLSELTTAVNRQNELLKKQHGAMKQLIEELRQGR